MKPTQQTPSTQSALTIIGRKIHMKTQLAAIVCLLSPTSAFADIWDSAELLGYTEITASTELTAIAPFGVEQVSDGITSDAPPFNGFASWARSGTVRLDFSTSFDLTSFILFNDVNVRAEGIQNFRLDFFDGSMNLMTQDDLGFLPEYTAPLGQLAGEEYKFGAVVEGVSRVDLVVLSSYRRIEIREVQFTAVPAPGSLTLLAAAPLLLRRRR